mmetsp:Transcript_1202/g.2869  ORF Transcript_1202/g.2869 Transcript_1202/m.2869 type:complete len:246 (-) Transcript_1202:1094-1831(-)
MLGGPAVIVVDPDIVVAAVVDQLGVLVVDRVVGTLIGLPPPHDEDYPQEETPEAGRHRPDNGGGVFRKEDAPRVAAREGAAALSGRGPDFVVLVTVLRDVKGLDASDLQGADPRVSCHHVTVLPKGCVDAANEEILDVAAPQTTGRVVAREKYDQSASKDAAGEFFPLRGGAGGILAVARSGIDLLPRLELDVLDDDVLLQGSRRIPRDGDPSPSTSGRGRTAGHRQGDGSVEEVQVVEDEVVRG